MVKPWASEAEWQRAFRNACQQAASSGKTSPNSNRVALRLNQRPRKTLEFLSPAEKFRESVALTA
jgi:IS30 family transposase